MQTYIMMLRATVLLCVLGCFSEYLSCDELNRQSLWRRPVPMHRVGVTHFFSEVFNMHGFGSYCCGPIIDFLAHSKNTSDPLTFSLRILDLFNARIKEAAWLSAYDVSEVICALREHVEPLFHKAAEMRVERVEKTLYQSLLNRFRDLKTHPEAFIHDVAVDILAVVDISELNRLRAVCISLIEGMLDRLIWCPQESEMAWQSVKDISDGLYELYKSNIIIDAAALNGCLWALLYRFCYVIETGEDDFSLSLYNTIKKDIAMGDSVLFAFPDDREGLMNSRAQWLRAVVIAVEARARQAREGEWVAPLR